MQRKRPLDEIEVEIAKVNRKIVRERKRNMRLRRRREQSEVDKLKLVEVAERKSERLRLEGGGNAGVQDRCIIDGAFDPDVNDSSDLGHSFSDDL